MDEFYSFDIELSTIPDDVRDLTPTGGWGVSVIGICNTRLVDGKWVRNSEYFHSTAAGEPAQKMVVEDIDMFGEMLDEIVKSGKPIITFNGAGFDLPVLYFESGNVKQSWKQLALSHYDVGYQILSTKGYMAGLGSIAKKIGAGAKQIDGELAPLLWQRKSFDIVIEYVQNDCILLSQVVEYILEKKKVDWVSQSGRDQSCPFDPFLTVEGCLELPTVDQSWQDTPLNRIDMIRWALSEDEYAALKEMDVRT